MVKEHIAIVSQDPYPDPRVEKEIYTLIKHGFDVTFIGKVREQPCLVFRRRIDNFRCVNVEFDRFTYSLLEPSLSKTLKRVQRVISDIKPEVVIAINPVAGYIVDKLGIPLLIDNHEYFYMQVKCNPLLGTKAMRLLKRVTYALGTLRRRWIYRVKLIEAKLASRHPMIFTNRYAKQDFMKRFNLNESDLFVLKNYPSRLEVGGMEDIKTSNEVKFGYIGFDLPTQSYHRDLSVAAEVLCSLAKSRNFKVFVAGVDYNYLCFQGVGWLNRYELYNFLSHIDFGLVTWAPHPLHEFFNPNKPYQYAIAGSVPVVTSTLKSVTEDLSKDAIIVQATDRKMFRDALRKTFEELLELSIEKREDLRERVMDYAKRRLIWENQEHTLLASIKKAK